MKTSSHAPREKPSGAPTQNADRRRYMGTVTRVVDGDTLDAEIDLGFGVITRQRMRLLEVDTPETHRPSCDAEREHGERATRFVEASVLGRRCEIETMRDKRGKYGRYLCWVYPPGSEKSINALLRENDLAKRDVYSC